MTSSTETDTLSSLSSPALSYISAPPEAPVEHPPDSPAFDRDELPSLIGYDESSDKFDGPCDPERPPDAQSEALSLPMFPVVLSVREYVDQPLDYNTTSDSDLSEAANRQSSDAPGEPANPIVLSDLDDLPTWRLNELAQMLDIDNMPFKERIERALEACRLSGFKSNGSPILSLREAADFFGVSPSTLTRHWHGGLYRDEAHEHQQILTNAQEDELVWWAKEHARRGVPLSRTTLLAYASSASGKEVGPSWIRRFLRRHPDLTFKFTSPLEAKRARALTKENVDSFYNIYESLCAEYSVSPENVYNMDEKGVQLGLAKKFKGLVDRDQATLSAIESGDKQLITIIECVSAIGEALNPTVIYAGQNIMSQWSQDNPCNASVSVSPNGWTDSELGSIWLEKDFEKQTCERVAGGYRILILDGHNSHCTLRFLKYAKENRILVICLPPHTTHALQPCDVGVFGPLQSHWKAEVIRHGVVLKVPITRRTFLRAYHNAREKAFKTETIQSAWRKTGIHPFDRNAIPAIKFAPARNTSIKHVSSLRPLPSNFLSNITLLDPSSAPTTTLSHASPPSATPSQAATTPSHTTEPSQFVAPSQAGSSQVVIDLQHVHGFRGDITGFADIVERMKSEAGTTPFTLLGSLVPRQNQTRTDDDAAAENRDLWAALTITQQALAALVTRDRLHEVELERQIATQESKKKKKKRAEYTTKAHHLTAPEQIDHAEDAERAKLIASLHREFKGTAAKPLRAQSTANTKAEAREYYDLLLDQLTSTLQREPSLTGSTSITVFEARAAQLKSTLTRPFPTPAVKAETAARAAIAATAAADAAVGTEEEDSAAAAAGLALGIAKATAAFAAFAAAAATTNATETAADDDNDSDDDNNNTHDAGDHDGERDDATHVDDVVTRAYTAAVKLTEKVAKRAVKTAEAEAKKSAAAQKKADTALKKAQAATATTARKEAAAQKKADAAAKGAAKKTSATKKVPATRKAPTRKAAVPAAQIESSKSDTEAIEQEVQPPDLPNPTTIPSARSTRPRPVPRTRTVDKSAVTLSDYEDHLFDLNPAKSHLHHGARQAQGAGQDPAPDAAPPAQLEEPSTSQGKAAASTRVSQSRCNVVETSPGSKKSLRDSGGDAPVRRSTRQAAKPKKA